MGVTEPAPPPDPIGKMADVRDMTEDKQEARMLAVRTVRRLEKKLRVTLEEAATLLKGMPNLSTGREPFRLARVRAEKIDLALAEIETGRVRADEALCLDSRGLLVMAAWVRHGRRSVIETRAVDDAELTAEDVEHVAECMAYVLDRHLGAQTEVAARFAELGRLAMALNAVLDTMEEVAQP